MRLALLLKLTRYRSSGTCKADPEGPSTQYLRFLDVRGNDIDGGGLTAGPLMASDEAWGTSGHD